jgi:hypothetical protein
MHVQTRVLWLNGCGMRRVRAVCATAACAGVPWVRSAPGAKYLDISSTYILRLWTPKGPGFTAVLKPSVLYSVPHLNACTDMHLGPHPERVPFNRPLTPSAGHTDPCMERA